jgi:L-aminopeptidase/D-esterase-like protein
MPLTPAQAKRMAKMAQSGLARAIRPIAAPFDGDVVFALAANDKNAAAIDAMMLSRVGSLAADCLTQAVANAVMAANSIGTHQCYRDWRNN